MKWVNKSIMNFSKFLFFIGLILAMNATASAQNRTHTVKAGETLFSIAREYGLSVDQLKRWNDISGNALSVGQTLIIENQKPVNSDSVITHEVQPQETLFSISKKYGVNISEIKAWNNLSGNTLSIGQSLKIYPPDKQTTGKKDRQGSLVVNSTVSSNTYYTVKSGDTLYKIAHQHNMSVNELKALNDLASNIISIGQQLTVKKRQPSAPSVAEGMPDSSPQGKFVNYTIEESQSLQSILQKFDMTKAEFTALNPDAGISFRQGQKITVLAPPTNTFNNPYTKQASLKDLGETVISVYESSRIGTTTTSGELYNPDQLTAAHSNIALGNVIFVQNPKNNKGIYVRINDRFSGRGLKLSQAAARSLDVSSAGATVNIYQDQ